MRGGTASPRPCPRKRRNADPSATPTPSATPSPSASPSPSGVEAFVALDPTDADDLPCDFATEDEATAALDGIGAIAVTTRYCVVSSAGEDLGCFRFREDAETRRRETGQQRLLDVIGTTARLEQREVLEVIPPGSPAYETTAVTCGTPEDRREAPLHRDRPSTPRRSCTSTPRPARSTASVP